MRESTAILGYMASTTTPEQPPPALTISVYNELADAEVATILHRVCSAPGWVDGLIAARPAAAVEDVCTRSDRLCSELSWEQIELAMAGHPRIGAASDHASSVTEQAAVLAADADILSELRAGNRAYEDRFGHVYLVAAAGRGPEELLSILRSRLDNTVDREREVVRSELAVINRLRLLKLFPAAVSVHVLDTVTGRPAVGVRVVLSGPEGPVAESRTDSDGRIPRLAQVPPGRYSATFFSGDYFPEGLYPEVVISVDLGPGKFHLPLLLAPFAYSTYRGS
jgi:2-oxo-4-hydroxy-4-carboxy-5-ureidoimidazoline decarboxylase